MVPPRHSSWPGRCDVRRQLGARCLRKLDHLGAGDRWKILHEVIDGVSGFQAVGQVFDRHARAGKNRCATENLGLGGDEPGLHAHKMHPTRAGRKG